MTDSVLLDVTDHIATITLNRPEALNALDRSLGEGLLAALQSCRDDPAVRAIILTGAGRAFCAGGDLKAAYTVIAQGMTMADYFAAVLHLLHDSVRLLRTIDRPVIAALNGVTAGAGISMAAACDLRIAAEGVQFKQAYTAVGLTPDGGWTALLPHLIGPARALELLLLDPRFDAAQAQAWGLVSEVVAADALQDRARALAERIAAGPATAFSGAKALVNASVFADMDAQLAREAAQIVAQSATADFLEGVQAFLAGRKPDFPGA